MHHYTLLDGEMVIDNAMNAGQARRRYLIYDMVAINGESVVEVGTVTCLDLFPSMQLSF